MKHLQNLLSKLSQREKFYFNQIHKDKKNANYWKIYEFLSKRPNATVSDLKAEFSNSLNDRNCLVEINYLYNHVLRSMHIYRLNQKENNQYYFKQLSFAEILLEKNLITEASKILRSLKKKALHFGVLERVIDIIRLEEKLEEKIFKMRNIDDLKSKEKEVSRILNELQNIAHLKVIKSELIFLQYKKSVTKVALNQIIKKVKVFLNSFTDIPFSAEGKDLWYSTNQIYNQYLDNYQLSLKYGKLQLHNNLENRHVFNDIQSMKILNNYLYLNVLQGEYQEFNENYDKIEMFQNSKELIYNDYLFFKIYLKVAMEIKMKHYDVLSSIIYSSFRDLDKHLDSMQSAYRNELMQYLVIGGLMVGDYKFAKTMLVQQSKYSNEEYSKVMSKINRLITYFVLKDSYLLKYELDNFKKTIDRKNIQNDTYKSLIQFFEKSISQKRYTKKDISDTIIKLEKAKNKKQLLNFIVELDYVAWFKFYIKQMK